jgi:hypothetical protein
MPEPQGLTREEVMRNYALGLYERRSVEDEISVREGWELAIEVLARVQESDMMKKTVAEIASKVPLENVEQLDKLVVLLSDVGLEEEGRKTAEVCIFYLNCPQ